MIYPKDIQTDKYLLKQFYIQKAMFGLLPKIIVEYERTPFVYKINSVRITIDYNICYIDNVLDFCKEGVQKFPILELGQALMEVKYNGVLPDFIAHIVQEFGMQKINNSKFYLSRLDKKNKGGF